MIADETFKRTFSRVVQVHFVGAWFVSRECSTILLSHLGFRDTVSAIGTTPGKILPFTVTGMTKVCFFRHALALDERRVKFIPEYAYGASTLPPSAQAQPQTSPPHTKEVWFVGSHSDMCVPNIGTMSIVAYSYSP